ncbi:MAG: hypothetical protein QW103_01550 [Candidatus Pacearchaeota archaeon]
MIKKRSQVTIFIIIGLIIFVLLIFFIFSKSTRLDFFIRDKKEPSLEIKNFIEKSIKENEEKFFKEKQFLQEFKIFYLYSKENISYTCYNEEFYFPCIKQSPLFIESIRRKMENRIARDLSRFLLKLKEDYEARGYSFDFSSYVLNLSFEEKTISFSFNSNIKVFRQDTSFFVSSIEGQVNSPLPIILRTVERINDYESTLCDFDHLAWQFIYRDIKIDKFRAGDGTKVYVLKSKEYPQKEIKFAIRTCVLPAGI